MNIEKMSASRSDFLHQFQIPHHRLQVTQIVKV